MSRGMGKAFEMGLIHITPQIAIDECAKRVPELREFGPGHYAACIRIKGYDSAPIMEAQVSDLGKVS